METEADDRLEACKGHLQNAIDALAGVIIPYNNCNGSECLNPDWKKDAWAFLQQMSVFRDSID